MLLLALLLTGAAPAPLDRGIQRYEALDYEAACPLFDQAAAAAGDDAQKAKALLWAGLCRAQLGVEDQARARFQKALRLDRSAALPAEAPPKIAAWLDEERAQLPPPKPPTTTTTTTTTEPATSTPATGFDATPVALWAAGGVVAVGAAAALVVAALQGSHAVGVDGHLQAVRADQTQPGSAVTALESERSAAQTAANIGFAVAGAGALAAAALITAGFVVE